MIIVVYSFVANVGSFLITLTVLFTTLWIILWIALLVYEFVRGNFVVSTYLTIIPIVFLWFYFVVMYYVKLPQL